MSSVIGDHNVESDENTKLFNIDANNLYGWAMSQPLPRGDFENLDNSHFTTQEIIEDLIIIPDDNESEFFIEGDLKYPVEIKEKTKEFSLCPYQTKADPEIFTTYIKSVKQPIDKPTNKLMCDQTKITEYMTHHRMFKFYINMGMKVTKVHSFWRFTLSFWLEKCIEQNTQKSASKKDFYKVMNISNFGKTMESVRHRTNLGIFSFHILNVTE